MRRVAYVSGLCEQASHGGELAAGVDAGVVARDSVTEIGAVLTGEADGRQRT